LMRDPLIVLLAMSEFLIVPSLIWLDVIVSCAMSNFVIVPSRICSEVTAPAAMSRVPTQPSHTTSLACGHATREPRIKSRQQGTMNGRTICIICSPKWNPSMVHAPAIPDQTETENRARAQPGQGAHLDTGPGAPCHEGRVECTCASNVRARYEPGSRHNAASMAAGCCIVIGGRDG